MVGAGHAGLAMSGLLGDAGREHLVLDGRDRLGGGGRTAGTSSGSSPRTGRPRSRAGPTTAPIRTGSCAATRSPSGSPATPMSSARPVALGTERPAPHARCDDGGFRATTSGGAVTARQVVVATGSYHRAAHPADRRRTSPTASPRSIRTTTATRPRCPPARCSSSGRDRPASSSPRSSSPQDAPCTSRSGPPAGCPVATAGATSSAGSSS